MMEPGIYTMSATDYHADPCPTPSLSCGTMKLMMSKSPLHAWLAHPRLGGHPDVDSDRFDAGTAAHSILLEGGNNIVVVQADDWRTKAAKEQRTLARDEGKVAMLESQFDRGKVRAVIARKFLRESSLGNILNDGKSEQSMFWCEKGGIWCRARADWLTTDRSIILDYKTTAMASPAQFCRSAMHQLGYDLQSAFYRRGIEVLTGRKPQFVFLVQEDDPPHSCYLVQCAPSMEQVAEHKMNRLMGRWQECLSSNAWPGYENTIYHAEATAWAITEEEEAL